MWFDVQAALAEIRRPDASGASSGEVRGIPRVAHVAHVARSPVPKSGNPRETPRSPDGLTPNRRDPFEQRAVVLVFDRYRWSQNARLGGATVDRSGPRIDQNAFAGIVISFRSRKAETRSISTCPPEADEG